MKIKAQTLLEYILVFTFATIVMYFFASKIDLSSLKSFAIYGIRRQTAPSVIEIPAMTK